jgi:hypothetical protein
MNVKFDNIISLLPLLPAHIAPNKYRFSRPGGAKNYIVFYIVFSTQSSTHVNTFTMSKPRTLDEFWFGKKRERETEDEVNPRRNQNQNTNAPPAMTRIQGAVAIAQMASGVVNPEVSKLLLELASQIVGAPAKERAGQIVDVPDEICAAVPPAPTRPKRHAYTFKERVKHLQRCAGMDLHNYADTHKIAVSTLRGWKKDAPSIYRAVASGHGNWVRERVPTTQ